MQDITKKERGGGGGDDSGDEESSTQVKGDLVHITLSDLMWSECDRVTGCEWTTWGSDLNVEGPM